MYKNKVMLCGRVTKNIDLRKTNTGKTVTTFSLAIDDGKDSNGQSKAIFVNCTAWEGTASLLSQYCGKGSLIGVEGHLMQKRWEERQVTLTEVFVESIQFLDTRKQEQEQAPQTEPQTDQFILTITSDDLPF